MIRYCKQQLKVYRLGADYRWSIFNPGVELSPVDWVEILYDYMEDFNPGVEMLYVPAIGSNKKAGLSSTPGLKMLYVIGFDCS